MFLHRVQPAFAAMIHALRTQGSAAVVPARAEDHGQVLSTDRAVGRAGRAPRWPAAGWPTSRTALSVVRGADGRRRVRVPRPVPDRLAAGGRRPGRAGGARARRRDRAAPAGRDGRRRPVPGRRATAPAGSVRGARRLGRRRSSLWCTPAAGLVVRDRRPTPSSGARSSTTSGFQPSWSRSTVGGRRARRLRHRLAAARRSTPGST